MKKAILSILLGLAVSVFQNTAQARLCHVHSPEAFAGAFKVLSEGGCQSDGKSVLYFDKTMDIFLEEPLVLRGAGNPILIEAEEGATVRIIGWSNGDSTPALTIGRPQVTLSNLTFSDFLGSALRVESDQVVLKKLHLIHNGIQKIAALVLMGNDIEVSESEIKESGLDGVAITDGRPVDECDNPLLSSKARHISLIDNDIHHNGRYGVLAQGFQSHIEGGKAGRAQIHDNGEAGIFLQASSAALACQKGKVGFDPLEILHTVFLSKVSFYGNGPDGNRLDIKTAGPVFPAPQGMVGTLDGLGNLTVSGHIPFSSKPEDPWSLGLVSPSNAVVEIYVNGNYAGQAEKVSLGGEFQATISKSDLATSSEMVLTALATDKILKVSSPFSESVKEGEGEKKSDDKKEESKTAPAPANADVDTDGDGAKDDVEENRLHTDPTKCDTDGDGLGDGLEAGMVNPEAATPECRGLQAAGTNFHKIRILNPLDVDSDGDGIPDGMEDANHNGWLDFNETDPTDPDTDGDDLDDGLEKNLDFDISHLANGDKCSPPSDRNDLDCDGIVNGRDRDSDNDGCLDSEEGTQDASDDGILDVWQASVKVCGSKGSSAPSGGGGGGQKPPESDQNKTLPPAEVLPAKGGGACQLMADPSTSLRAGSGQFILILLAYLYLTSMRVFLESEAKR